MHHISDSIVPTINWALIFFAMIITEGDQKTIMFVLGVVASAVTIASKVYDMHLKRRANKEK